MEFLCKTENYIETSKAVTVAEQSRVETIVSSQYNCRKVIEHTHTHTSHIRFIITPLNISVNVIKFGFDKVLKKIETEHTGAFEICHRDK